MKRSLEEQVQGMVELREKQEQGMAELRALVEAAKDTTETPTHEM